MTETEINSDDPPRVARDIAIRIERLDHRREKLQRKHWARAELRRSLKSGLAFSIAVRLRQLFTSSSGNMFDFIAANTENSAVRRRLG